MVEQITAIFCDIDDFCEEYKKYCTRYLLMDEKHIIPKTSMEMSEIMTIVVFFHLSSHRTFKWYYKDFVSKYLREYFPKLVSYNRFIEIMQWVSVPLTLYLTKYRFGKCTGVSFVDSTPLDVCDVRRISTHRVFKAVAKRGKSSMGWFYGFKLHIVINHHGELLAFCLTAGNVDDRNMAVLSMLTKEIFGKLYADRGYISQSLFDHLLSEGITLVTKVKRNMKNRLMELSDRLILKKRMIIECVINFLKLICQIEHTRHRSVANFIVNVIAALVAYSYILNKPHIVFINDSSTLPIFAA